MGKAISTSFLVAIVLAAIPFVSASDTVARPMEMSSFRKLFPNHGFTSDVASDNSQECTASVRKALSKAHDSWGPFHFFCKSGLVRNVFAEAASRINTTPGKFATENRGLFGISSPAIRFVFKGDSGMELNGEVNLAQAEIFRAKHSGPIPRALTDVRDPADSTDSYFIYEFDVAKK